MIYLSLSKNALYFMSKKYAMLSTRKMLHGKEPTKAY